MLSISAISVENLRGYEDTELDLKKLTVLVGENNEGKSSLLKMFERFMSSPSDFWKKDGRLSEEEFDFWYPANNAKKRGRRFTVWVNFRNGNTAKSFGAKKGSPLALRFAVNTNGNYRLNIGQPKRGEVHDARAVKLFNLLQRKTKLILLPPVRDAKTSTFSGKVTREIKEQLRKNIGHNKQAGAPLEYRLAKEAIQKIKRILALQNGELSRSDNSPLASMLKASEVRLELFPKDIYELIEKSIHVYLSTGPHDVLKVLPGEVGNGLQSLIDINLELDLILNSSEKVDVIVIIEEPEAFLHPSAQRQFMQYLRRVLVEKVSSAILTTHSPIILDEAKYEEIVLVRNQTHFSPADVPSDRASINTSLMTATSAEMFFARTIVFVEGEGDRAFFNTLFRRIKDKVAVCPELAGLVFQITGGCTFYAPWLKLARSYEYYGKYPFNYIWIMDGDVATKNGNRPVLQTANNAGFSLTKEEIDSVVKFGDLDWGDGVRDVACANDVNVRLRRIDGHLFSCDLEWAFFNQCSDESLKKLKKAFRASPMSDAGDRKALAKRIGSKIGNGKSSDHAKKHPYIRALIAEHLDLSALPPEIFIAVKKILNASYQSVPRVADLLKTHKISTDQL